MSGYDTEKAPDGIPEQGEAGAGDEIDLLALWRTLVKRKLMILGAASVAAIITAIVALQTPNVYRGEILLAPAQAADDARAAGLASALGGLGGFASMAGIAPGGVNTEENLAVLRSHDFLWKFAQEKNLMPVLFSDRWDAQQRKWKESDPKKQPGPMDVYRLFNDGGAMSVARDKKTGLITLAVEWNDAALAAELANALVQGVNQYLAQRDIKRSESNIRYLNDELARTEVDDMRRILYAMIANERKNAMLANAQKDYAFKVLDPAVVQDQKIRPRRSRSVLLAAAAGGAAAAAAVLLGEAIMRRRTRWRA